MTQANELNEMMWRQKQSGRVFNFDGFCIRVKEDRNIKGDAYYVVVEPTGRVVFVPNVYTIAFRHFPFDQALEICIAHAKKLLNHRIDSL